MRRAVILGIQENEFCHYFACGILLCFDSLSFFGGIKKWGCLSFFCHFFSFFLLPSFSPPVQMSETFQSLPPFSFSFRLFFVCVSVSLLSLSLSLSRSACWLCIHYLVFEKIKGMQKTQSPKREMNDLENSCDFLRLPFCLKNVVSLFVSLLDRCGNVFCVCV